MARFDEVVFGKLRWSRCGSDVDARRLYKAQLCASCHAMRAFGGRASSLLANYDQSLLVLVLSALAGGELAPRRCTAVPWRQVAVQDLPADLRAFVAAGNLALVDAKLRDDVDDGGRWYAGPLRWLLRGRTRRALQALRRLGFDAALVERLPDRQRAIERAGGHDLMAFAQPSEELLGEIFAFGAGLAGAGDRSGPARRFGAAVARAVYALDALEDHDDDRARQRFNAIAQLAERLGHAPAVEAAARAVQLSSVEAQQLATQLLPRDRRDIVTTIVQGLARRADEHRDRLLGRPAAAALRPAEAGDCDCACDGCSGCDSCDGGGCCALPCDCACCCDSQRERRRQRDERALR
ncbi:MAG: hypothetical protein KAI24_04255 [Planctomycetes bacterium]|nr:hypothetical protein [Planctomycetota bacterium]